MRKTSARAKSGWPVCVAAGPFLFFSGQMGYKAGSKARSNERSGDLCKSFADVAGQGPAQASGSAWVDRLEGPVGAQGIAIYEQYRALLKRQGGDLKHLLRYHIYQRDKRYFPVFDRVRREYEPAPPSSTAVGMGRFERTDQARLCIDAIALQPAAEKTLGPREVRGGAAAHTAAATFSHVIGAGPYLFLAGQIPIDASKAGAPLIRNYDDIPEAGHFLRRGRSHEDARNGPIAAQTWFTYDLIRQHLEAAGSSLDSILNLIVYLQDMRDFPTFHRVHERFFKAAPPALTVIEVGEVGHKGTLIEIEPTAIVRGSGIERRVHTSRGAQPAAHMSAIVEAGGLAFLSGIAGVDAAGEPVISASALPRTVRAQAAGALGRNVVAVQCIACIEQLKAQLAAAGRDLASVAHLSVYMKDIES
ncbi:MAG TPA: RidA family protein, partial [Burkholderiales bacterium]|nr:RidA family protein [Burkholderiales bacterium]